jgi:hypothetical protein
MATYPQTTSATQLAQWVAIDPNLRQDIANDPATLLRFAKPPRDGGQLVYLVVTLVPLSESSA